MEILEEGKSEGSEAGSESGKAIVQSVERMKIKRGGQDKCIVLAEVVGVSFGV